MFVLNVVMIICVLVTSLSSSVMAVVQSSHFTQWLTEQSLETPFARYDRRFVKVNGSIVSVVVSDTTKKQRLGLSYITKGELLADADGMVFVFDNPVVQKFWMNGMLFDLDVLWVQDGEVVKISKGVEQPTSLLVPTMDSSPWAVETVFEFPAGFVETYDVKIGDQLEWIEM